MEFTFINLLAMMYCSLLVIVEMIHTIKGVRKVYPGKTIVIILDYVFKYASFILMFVPLGITKFNFRNVVEMLIYVVGDAILVIIYDVLFIKNVRRDSLSIDNRLLYILIVIFLLSGVILRHYLLIICALGYCYTHKKVLNELGNQYNER